MFIFFILLLSILIALVRGGRLGNLADLNLRWRGFIVLGFLIQVVIFSSPWQDIDATRAWTQIAYLLSLCLLTIGLAANYRIPGMTVITLGFFLNFAAIAANGGYMPGSAEAYQAVGFRILSPGQVYNNSVGMGPTTPLAFLGDIFAIPKALPFHNVFSIGDTIIAIGAFYLLQRAMVPQTSRPAK
jgi:hypothetical protein